MSLLTEAGTAVETVTGASWWRLAWKLTPWVAIAVLAVGLQLTRSTLALARADQATQIARLDAAAARASAANSDRVAQAVDAFAARTAALQPLIVHSTDTVTRYAETPAGRARCLDADRLRGIDALDASLRDPGTPGGGAPAVQPDPGAPPAGR